MSDPEPLLFEHSRRLTGSNLYFDAPGAVLETRGIDVDDALIADWHARVARGRGQLGWDEAALALHAARRPFASIVARRHRGGAALAIAAPVDQLYTATELNEWALAASLCARDPVRRGSIEAALVQAAEDAVAPPALPPVIGEAAALARLLRLSALEARPPLRAAIDRATANGLGYLLDDEGVSFGESCGHATYRVGALPRFEDVPWEALHNVPVALVTGSNGKTTTVRLLAACARAQGWRTAYNCTDGVFLDGEQLASGDFSGPMGACAVLREPRAHAAVIEAARGGILRRGLAASRADTAVVTNVSPDHLGGYGIDDLDGMAAVKLVVAHAVGPGGLVVLNADDPTLVRGAGACGAPIGWFARDFDAPMLRAHRGRGGSASGVRAGRLVATYRDAEHDLGAIADLPLTISGLADYNIANLAAASLAALALGVAPAAIAAVFARFGSSVADNPGRLMRFDLDGVHVVVDYAHNPDGLRGVLAIARNLATRGRLMLLLGQAGDRGDADIEALAAAAAAARPDVIVLKEMAAYLRGREPGEVPAILRRALTSGGVDAARLFDRDSELEAARTVLALARPGDVLLLLVHGYLARGEVVSLIGRMRAAGWRAGDAVPA
ncbi:MAG: Mur ligase family protein [Steroidobacteraceae bacterium]